MKKIIYILIIIISFSIIFYLLVWPHLVFFYLTKNLDSGFDKKPVAHQIEFSDPETREKVTFFKVSFDVPWEISEISTSTQRYAFIKGNDSQEIRFDRHGAHSLFDTSRIAKQIFYKHFKDKKYYNIIDKLVLAGLSKEYKNQVDLAGFDLFREVYNINKKQIKLFSSLESKINIFKLNLFKDILMYQDRDVYEFETDWTKGFQFDKNEDSNEVILYFFNEKNEWYSLDIRGSDQGDIDKIINSIEFVFD